MEPWHSDVFEFLDLRKNTGESLHEGFYHIMLDFSQEYRPDSQGPPSRCPL